VKAPSESKQTRPKPFEKKLVRDEVNWKKVKNEKTLVTVAG